MTDAQVAVANWARHSRTVTFRWWQQWTLRRVCLKACNEFVVNSTRRHTVRRAFNIWLDYAVHKAQKQERCHQVPLLSLPICLFFLLAVPAVTNGFDCSQTAPVHHNWVCPDSIFLCDVGECSTQVIQRLRYGSLSRAFASWHGRTAQLWAARQTAQLWVRTAQNTCIASAFSSWCDFPARGSMAFTSKCVTVLPAICSVSAMHMLHCVYVNV